VCRRIALSITGRPRLLIPQHGRNYYGAAVGSALVPKCVDCRSRSRFHASVATASLGTLKVLTMSGHAHAVTRGPHELAHSEWQINHLMINIYASWRVVQNGQARMRPGYSGFRESVLPHALRVGTFELSRESPRVSNLNPNEQDQPGSKMGAAWRE
jgi:hypothetical protein